MMYDLAVSVTPAIDAPYAQPFAWIYLRCLPNYEGNYFFLVVTMVVQRVGSLNQMKGIRQQDSVLI